MHRDGMSYDLAVWVGRKPNNATEASAEYGRRMDAMEELLGSDGVTPTVAPEIGAFVDAALARFPELTEDSGPECPWASSPLLAEAVGDLIYLPMTFSGAEYARDELAELAASRGLVCYDPQIEALLPNPDATSASEIGAKASAALAAYVEQESEAARSAESVLPESRLKRSACFASCPGLVLPSARSRRQPVQYAPMAARSMSG